MRFLQGAPWPLSLMWPFVHLTSVLQNTFENQQILPIYKYQIISKGEWTLGLFKSRWFSLFECNVYCIDFDQSFDITEFDRFVEMKGSFLPKESLSLLNHSFYTPNCMLSISSISVGYRNTSNVINLSPPPLCLCLSDFCKACSRDAKSNVKTKWQTKVYTITWFVLCV